MANRPVYVANTKEIDVGRVDVVFEWFAGFAKCQCQKSIRSQHGMFNKYYPKHRLLEVSSASENPLGVALSAFNLRFKKDGEPIYSVESLFQSCKEFERGGPFPDILHKSSMDAKTDIRIRENGKTVKYHFQGKEWETNPGTMFYDWLYINALLQNPPLVRAILEYDAFTDIKYNPKRGTNCQAKSCALFVSWVRQGKLRDIMKNDESYRDYRFATMI